ncbi:hypothetical protein [Brevibacillus sp. NRS-1366]|uniref:hypothetical protein n=1 Tax=Brevibacillus sp. NRS-1366 TaxID=3233899 RepID=UPI003D1B63C9
MNKQSRIGKEYLEQTEDNEGAAKRIEEQEDIVDQDDIEEVYGAEDNDIYAG